MFKTFKTRLAIVLSGAWVIGAGLAADRGEEFFPLLAIGWAAIWLFVFGADWVLKAPGAEARTAGIDARWQAAPQWARYGLLIVLAGIVMGLAKAVARMAFN